MSVSTLAAGPPVPEYAAENSAPAAETGRAYALPVTALLALGTLLRLIQYFSDRPLWFDEAMLAHNVLSRSFAGLAGTLSESQIAPLGFLYLEKTTVILFGSSEASLRLVPLLAGLASLALFWMVAVRLVSRPAAHVALAMFAVSPRLIYYSAEVKQYSMDVAVCLAVVLVAIEARRREFSPRWAGGLAAACVVAAWFSQPSAFVVTGVFVAIGVDVLLRSQREAVRRVAAAAAVAVSSIAASAVHARAALRGSNDLPSFWVEGFLPLPPTSAGELWAWGEAFIRAFRDPLMFSVPLLAVAAYVGGVAFLARRRETMHLLILVAPVLLTMLAAGLRLYPFGDNIFYGGRVLLFLAPLLLIPVAVGVDALRGLVGVRPVPFAVLAVVAMGAPRFVESSITSLHEHVPAAATFVFPSALPPMRMEWQDPRPLLREMAAHTRDDDVIYVFDIAGPPFRYYAPRLGVAGTWVRGSASGGNAGEAATEVDMLRGHPRAWLFFAYAYGGRYVPFIEHANRIGEPLMVLEHEGTAAVLYDLSSK